jgi:hypothetical protein
MYELRLPHLWIFASALSVSDSFFAQLISGYVVRLSLCLFLPGHAWAEIWNSITSDRLGFAVMLGIYECF